MDESKVLVVIPAYNEGRIIRHVVQEILQHYPECTVLVVNDGSSDNTAAEAIKAGAKLVSLPFNLGIGGAVQTGFKFAHQEGFDVVAQIDGDAQHDPLYLASILEPVLSGELDLCIGSRFLNQDSGFKSTFLRRFGIRFFSVLLSRLTGVPLSDPTSGFRACNKKLLSSFASYYPMDFPEPEAIQVAKRLGARIGERPVVMRTRLGGISSIRYFTTLYYMVKVTLAILIDTLREKSSQEDTRAS
ncbi:MAG: glycosyltransferase family 2 protein [Candidatus Omnitrophica bacterium]|nr:glycosyltransferase family 2 protein [Candidatus Omnitrophota bacterium]